jgi:LacI family transcriptional regulator
MGDIDWSPSYEERWEGYKKALRHNHIRYQEEFILTKVKEERSSLYRTLDNFSEKLENWPTAWLCTNSGLGFILISYFQSIGFNIPENISVCCFDDTEFTLLSNPRITTVAVKLDDMGHQAVVLMGRRLEHPEAPPIHILLPTHLIERESTGHPQNKD